MLTFVFTVSLYTTCILSLSVGLYRFFIDKTCLLFLLQYFEQASFIYDLNNYTTRKMQDVFNFLLLFKPRFSFFFFFCGSMSLFVCFQLLSFFFFFNIDFFPATSFFTDFQLNRSEWRKMGNYRLHKNKLPNLMIIPFSNPSPPFHLLLTNPISFLE